MKIALFIATPVKRNSGMYSVDCAAINLFKNLQIDFEILTTQENEYELLGKKSKIIRSTNKLYNYTHIVYWGDFINNPMYGMTDFSMRDVKRKISKNRAIAFDCWASLYALQDFDKKHLKIISVGNNFHFDLNDFPTPSFFKRTDYRSKAKTALKNIENKFDLILPRDNYSTTNLLAHFSKINHTKVKNVLDCAFLLEDDIHQPKRNQVTTYLYRSSLSTLYNLEKHLEDKYGFLVLNNPWLELPDERQKAFNSYTNDMRQSLFTITDTYHFAINSLRLGTISICIGRKETNQIGTLGDFKKKELYKTLGLLDFYIEIDENASTEAIFDLIDETINFTIDNPKLVQSKIDNINKNIVRNFKDEILNFLKKTTLQ